MVPSGIRLHGFPRWRTADLLLLTDEVILERNGRQIHLRWEDYGRDDATRRWGPRNIRALWFEDLAIAPVFRSAHAPGVGTGIGVRPQLLDRSFLNEWWLARPLLALGVRRAVPVVVPGGIRAGMKERRRDKLRALLHLMALRPDLRSRLAEPRRAQGLALALAERCQPIRSTVEPFAVRPAPGGLAKLEALGLPAHFSGRPFPDQRPPTEELIEQWRLDQLEDPWWSRTRNSSTEVAETLRRLYCNVEPWPFEALLDDD